LIISVNQRERNCSRR